MIGEPKCYTRKCKHFLGIKTEDNIPEKRERPFCKAFLDKIPLEIAYGENLHLIPLEGQGNDIVYEKKGKE